MRLLGTGRPRTNERTFTQSDRCRRHGRLTQSRWSFPQQPMSRDWILPCQIHRPWHHDAWPSSVSISAFALLEFVRREVFECGRSRVLSGAWCVWSVVARMARRMLGANVEYYQIDNLKLTTTLACLEWTRGKMHGSELTKPCSARPATDASLSGQKDGSESRL
jgi:hypothetical protein